MQPPYRHPLACAIVLCAAALGSFTACSSAAVDEAAAKPAPVADARPFDPRRAWSEWIQLLTLDYGYFQRPGVDGQAIAAHFAPRAASATTRPELVALMQQMARNFADPHLNVGPGAADGPSLVPTASDLHGDWVDGRFVIRDVRADSDASQQGVAPGDIVVSIDGRAPAAAVESLLGRPLETLSREQVAFGLTVALAGVRDRPRRLVTSGRSGLRGFALRSAGEQASAVAAAPALTSDRRGDVGIIRFNNSLGRDETIAAFARALRPLLDTRALVIDLRNTPSGGTSTVARGVLGHFVTRERPYQVHTVPGESRRYGVPRKFVEYVLPIEPLYRGHVVVLGGRWTGSMGEGMVIGFDAIGVRSAGSPMGHLLGAMFHETLAESGATVELGEEQLFHVNGTPREAFVPRLRVEPAEAGPLGDPTLSAAMRALGASQAGRAARKTPSEPAQSAR
jgi:peptidase S41-like protein